MSLLVRSWNVFHGREDPPGRDAYLEHAVRLASADGPDVLCLQEVPVWALPLLEGWSGMTAVADVAAQPRLGPLPIPAELGRRLTALHHAALGSLFSGQANAVLVRRGLRPLERRLVVLNERRFRRAQARRLALDPVVRLAWAKERRICQVIRLGLPGDATVLVANLHATSLGSDERLADAELLRAAVFVDGTARPDETVVLAGDFNVRPERSRALADLTRPEWGFSRPGPGLDHVLVRGAESSRLVVWPDERRRQNGRLLSDHAPVELTIS